MRYQKIVNISLALILMFLSHGSYAQVVGTLLSAYNSNGDIAVDSEGNVYLAGDGTLRRVSPDGEIVVVSTGFFSAKGMDFDAAGNLYVAIRNSGFVRKVTPDGTVSIISQGLSMPTGLAATPDGVVYVSHNWGVKRIDPSGLTSVLSSDPVFNRPHGITVDTQGHIYVASAHDGNIYKVTESEDGAMVEHFAFVDGLIQAWACGFMVFHDEHLYITNGDNKVHKITMDGVVSDYAGNGNWGYVDGPAAQAEFMAPAGIAEESNGIIYVAEYNKLRVRSITQAVSAVDELPVPAAEPLRMGQNHPNPFNPTTTISFKLPKSAQTRLSVFDVAGRKIRTLVDGALNEGGHSVAWDGKNDAGKVQSTGVYYYQLLSADERISRKMLLMK